ncbi:MAG: sporulation protein YtfJ [Oscillospiraceae bacterium]|nr:sporulation protein YtfJ [Oscillospiraceae bacterium]MBQ8978853.1 sporulation protein YtfJ [Oscillospiraceae bacterium]
MSEQTKVKELVSAAMDKVHEMADANTILGNPVKVDKGVTIIPICKVSYGFASGGSDLPTKSDREFFGGASGAGISFNPLGFLVISDGKVELLQMKLNYGKNSTVVDMVPEVFDKVAGLFKKDKNSDAIERHNEKIVTEAAVDAVAEAEENASDGNE